MHQNEVDGFDCQVVEALSLDSKLTTLKWIPAEATPSTCNEDGKPPWCSFSYASVVGMLIYITDHSMPDIPFIIHPCMCYMFNPCLSRAKTLMQIARFLKATREKGLVLKP